MCVCAMDVNVIPTQQLQLNQMSQMSQMSQVSQVSQADQMNRLPPEFLMPVPFCEFACDFCCWAFCECGLCLYLCYDD